MKVKCYLRGLMDSLLIYQTRRYHIKGKQYLANITRWILICGAFF